MQQLGCHICGTVDKKPVGTYRWFSKRFEMCRALKMYSCLGVFESISLQFVLILSSKLFLCLTIRLFATVFTHSSYSMRVFYIPRMPTTFI
jgi:hypothetical protein